MKTVHLLKSGKTITLTENIVNELLLLTIDEITEIQSQIKDWIEVYKNIDNS